MVAIYARQSIDRENSISIDSQIAHCRNIINEPNKTYIDRGYSGSNICRPAFEELLADIKAGAISAVYCYRLDRISRNILDFANLQEYFKRYNCSFVSSSENLDTSSPMGRAMVNIIMVFAQLERETIAGRIKDSYFARARLGAYLGGGLPFGYRITKAQFNGKTMSALEPDPETSSIAADIFKTYAAARTSLRSIAADLNDRGVLSSAGKPFTSNAVRRILMNPVYVAAMPEIYDYYFSKGCEIYNVVDDFDGAHGCLLTGKEHGKNNRVRTSIDEQTLIVSSHAPLVDAATFLSAQYRLGQNGALRRAGTGQVTWLGGLIKCGSCGYCVSVKVSKGYKYLTCRGRDAHGSLSCENRKYHPLEDVERFIENNLLNYVDNIDVEKLRDCEPQPENVETKQRLIKIQQQIDNLVQALADGQSVNSHIIKKIEALDAEKEGLTKLLAPAAVINPESVLYSINEIKEKWHTLDNKKKNELAGVFIKSIVAEGDSFDIEWKAPDLLSLL